MIPAVGYYRRKTGILTGALLDSTSVPAAIAYSLRQLRAGYTGPAINVRRDSDNANLGIGFVNGSLDTASLLAFVGAGNGYVVVWYDQSGHGLDAENLTQSQQPLIVSAGALVTMNGLPAMSFDNQGLPFNNESAAQNDYTISAVFSTTQINTASGDTNWYLANGFVWSEQSGVVGDFGFGNQGGKLTLGQGQSGVVDTAIQSVTSINDGFVYAGTAVRDSTSGVVNLYLDGTLETMKTCATGQRSASVSATIGNGNGSVCLMFEAIIFASKLNSADLAALSTWQATYTANQDSAAEVLFLLNGDTLVDAKGHASTNTGATVVTDDADFPHGAICTTNGWLIFSGFDASAGFGVRPFTLEWDYKAIAKAQSYPCMLSLSGPSAAGDVGILDHHDAEPTSLALELAGRFPYFDQGTTIGTLYQCALVFDGTNYTLFMNGSPVSTTTAGRIQLTQGIAVGVAHGNQTTSNAFDGLIGKIRLTTRAALYTEAYTPTRDLWPTS